jgi:type IV pilus assembly protein PilM
LVALIATITRASAGDSWLTVLDQHRVVSRKISLMSTKRDLSLDTMFSFSRTQSTPIGLHLSARSVTMVQLSGPSGRTELSALAQSQLPPRDAQTDEQYDDALATTLRLMVSGHPFRGRSVVSCVTADDLFLQSVRLPQLPAEEIEKVVRWEADERLPYPAQNAELRYLLAGQVRQESTVKQEVVLMACQQTVLQRHLRVLDRAGLTPRAVDVEPCAVLRAFRYGLSENTDRVAYLHLGDSLTTVVIADGDAILFLKYVATGGRELDQAVAKHLELEPAEANRWRASVTGSAALDSQNEIHRSVIEATRPLLESLTSEVELCFRYFVVTFRGQPVTKLVVTGHEASAWLAEYLGQSLSCPVEVGNPFVSLCRQPHTRPALERPGHWTTALGLSLRTVC